MAVVDYTQPVGQVRLLINDDGESDQVFSDLALQGFLDLEGNVKAAAAQALDVIADDEALTSKVIRTQDLQTDGATVAAGLRARAKSLRDQVVTTTAGAMSPQGVFPPALRYPDPAQRYPC